MLFACLAVDGTANKTYRPISGVGERYRRFNENLDIIELMFGGVNLRETVYPFKDARGRAGIGCADVVCEKFRCNLAHGSELPDGYGTTVDIRFH